MSFPKVDDIDITGYRLIQLLEIKDAPQVSFKRQSVSKALYGIGEPVDWTDLVVDSAGVTEHSEDGWGNITSVKRSVGGRIFELSLQNYPLLKAIATKFLEKEEYYSFADSYFVEQEIFEWLVGIAIQQRVMLNLTAHLEKRLDEEIAPYKFYFRLRPIGISSEIHFGGVTIFLFTQKYLHSIYDKLSIEDRGDWESYKGVFKDFIDTIVVAVEAKAVNSMAQSLAETKAVHAVNALKCFLFPEAASSQHYLFELDFKATPPEFSTYIVKYTEEGNLRLNKKNQGGIPIELTHNVIARLERMGLQIFNDFLQKHHSSQFDYLILRAIDQLGDAFSKRDMHSRAVELVSFFELFLNYENKAGAKPQTYLIRNLLPHLLPQQMQENGKKIVQLLYRIRDRYLHNRQRLAFDIQDLLDIQILAFDFLKLMIILSKQLSSKEDFFNHFGIQH